MTSHVISAAAEYERNMISVRTREALAARKARGERHGIPSALSPEVLHRIVDEHREGRTLRSIAGGLMGDGIPTARGGQTWHASTVRAVLNSQDAASLP
jgi:DNA invertase Pin-like site-specific DNA recombinase